MTDEMTLAEAGDIFSYWEQNPPMHLMVQTIACLLGWTPGAMSAPTSFKEIVAAAPPGVAVAQRGLDMPAPLDRSELEARNRARQIAIARRNRHTADI